MFEARIAPGLAIVSSRSKIALLEVHVLERRFDHEVGVGQRIEVERRAQLAHPLLHLVKCHAALLGGVLVVSAHDRDAPVERLLRGLDDRHGNAGAQEIHRNAAAHGAGADDADLGDLSRRRVGGDVGDLRRLPLGEKDIALRLGLICDDEPAENRALLRHALIERQIDRVLDGLDRPLPGLEAAVFSRIGLATASKISGWPRAGSILSDRSRTFFKGAFSAIEAPGVTKRRLRAAFPLRRARRRRPIPWPRAR